MAQDNRSELILFRPEDAQTRIQVRLEGDSVWLSQLQLADLYQVSVKTISEHLQNIFDEGEVEPERTIRKFRIVQIEGERQPNAGMTNWVGTKPRKADARVAKSYLDTQELEALNGIVTAYLEFARVQAMNRKAMTMADWTAKLDDFLRLSERDILTHAGRITHERAVEFADKQFDQYRQEQINQPSQVERDFEEATRNVKALERSRKLPTSGDGKKPRKRGESKGGRP